MSLAAQMMNKTALNLANSADVQQHLDIFRKTVNWLHDRLKRSLVMRTMAVCTHIKLMCLISILIPLRWA
jgi:hypothetical protein